MIAVLGQSAGYESGSWRSYIPEEAKTSYTSTSSYSPTPKSPYTSSYPSSIKFNNVDSYSSYTPSSSYGSGYKSYSSYYNPYYSPYYNKYSTKYYGSYGSYGSYSKPDVTYKPDPAPYQPDPKPYEPTPYEPTPYEPNPYKPDPTPYVPEPYVPIDPIKPPVYEPKPVDPPTYPTKPIDVSYDTGNLRSELEDLLGDIKSKYPSSGDHYGPTNGQGNYGYGNGLNNGGY